MAYNQEADRNQLQKFWADYFLIEKGIYEKLLTAPDEEVRGTVKELAEKYNIDVMTMGGFLDGINDSLKTPNPIEEMDENTEVSLAFDKELLYKNMVDARADWLYNLPMWDEIFTLEKKKELLSYIRTTNRTLYGKLRHSLMGNFMNLPGRGGRKVSVAAYKISQKFYGFN